MGQSRNRGQSRHTEFLCKTQHPTIQPSNAQDIRLDIYFFFNSNLPTVSSPMLPK
jgi:hypothetical protein